MSKRLVVDSSILIVLSRRNTLEEYLQRRKKEGYQVLIPKAIARELIDEPEKLARNIRAKSPVLADKILQSVEAINEAIEDNLIKLETVNYRKYSKLIDNVRKHLSQLEAKPQHAIKKGDPELIALAVQLYEKSREKVYVSTEDKALLRTFKSFRDRVEYEISEGL